MAKMGIATEEAQKREQTKGWKPARRRHSVWQNHPGAVLRTFCGSKRTGSRPL